MLALTIIVALLVAAGIVIAFAGISRMIPATGAANEQSRMAERLAQFMSPVDGSLAEAELSTPLVDRVIRPLLERLGEWLLKRMSAQSAHAWEEQLELAGRPGNITAGEFQALRVVLGVIVGALIYVAARPFIDSPALEGLTLAAMLCGLSTPKWVVSYYLRRRKNEIVRALPGALDLLTLTVEAGLTFDAGMARVVEKQKGPLGAEFARYVNQVRLGRPRAEALEEMGERYQIEEVKIFAQAVIQSDVMGAGIASVLRIQADEVRTRRRQRAEELGRQAPLKMLFPMVGCIFPTLFVVILGPAALVVLGNVLGS